MTNSSRTCTAGRDPAEILAYLDRELSEQENAAFEAHLRTCSACWEEFQALRRIRSLLSAHPESFHPDAAELYRYVKSRDDAHEEISAHLSDCGACRDAVQAIEGMIAVQAEGPRTAPPMPRALARQLEQIHAGTGRSAGLDKQDSWFGAWLRRPFRGPILALGTAAAVVIVVFLASPLRHALKHVPQPGSVPSREAPVPSPQSQAGSSPNALQSKVKASEPEVQDSSERKQFQAVPGRRAPVEERARSEEAREPLEKKALAQKRALQRQNFGQPPAGMPAFQPETKTEASSGPARADAERDRRLVPPPASVAPGAGRNSVALRIEGPEGQDLYSLADSIPQEVRDRFTFVEESAGKPSRGKGEGGRARDKLVQNGLPEPSMAPFHITITIRETGGGYTVEGRLYEKGSQEEAKTITDLEVPIEKLPQKVGGLVRDLLASY